MKSAWKRRLILLIFLGGVFTSVLGTVPAGATYWFRIVNGYSGKCLDDTGWSTSAGTQMQQYSCTGGANQNWSVWWQYSPQDVTWMVFQNQYSGKCLDVYQGRTTTNYQPVVQWYCNSGDFAQNLYVNLGTGYNTNYHGACTIQFIMQSVYSSTFAPTGYLVSQHPPSTSNGQKTTIYYNDLGGQSDEVWCQP
jgi:hypothetical protein